MTILFFILSCLIVGILSRFFYPGKVPMSWLKTIIIGVGAAIAGNLIGWILGIGSVGLIGSILLGVLLIYLDKKYNNK